MESNERVYQMPPLDQDIDEYSLSDFLEWWAGEAQDLYVLDEPEVHMRMIAGARQFRYAADLLKQLAKRRVS